MEKKKGILLNSAIMMSDGYYFAKTIPAKVFANFVYELYKDNNLTCYIGYKETVDFVVSLVKKHLDKDIVLEVNRSQAKFDKDNCIGLVIQLNRRVNPGDKGSVLGLSEDDFVFRVVYYFGDIKSE